MGVVKREKADHRPARTRVRTVLRWLGETLLTALAVFGVICVAAVIAAYAFGINIMMFKTGSMSSEIPAGSVALVRSIPAAEAEVGDVVTVERPGQLPITHRVVSNEPDPDNPPERRIIQMKGDDNPQPDPFPYRMEEVKLLFWSHPEWGRYVALLADPRVLGGGDNRGDGDCHLGVLAAEFGRRGRRTTGTASTAEVGDLQHWPGIFPGFIRQLYPSLLFYQKNLI